MKAHPRNAAIAIRTAKAFVGPIAAIAGVTIVLAAVAAALPRSVDAFLTDGLRYDAAQSTAISRDILAEQDANLRYGPPTAAVPDLDPDASEAWGRVEDDLSKLRQQLPSELRKATAGANVTVVTKAAPSQPYAKPQADVSLGYDPRFLSRIEVLEGTSPRKPAASIPSTTPIEVMASESVAETLAWEIGGTRTLFLPDRLQQDVVLVGIFEATDPDDGYWEHTVATLRPTILSTPPSTHATVFANAAGVESAVASVLTTRSSIWYPVAPGELTAGEATALAQQVRKLASVSQQIGDQKSLVFQSGLAEVLEKAARRNVSTQAILVTILAGPFGLAAAIEFLTIKLVAARMRPSLELLSARGVSARQRRLLLGIPSLLIGLVASVVGAIVGALPLNGEISPGAIAAIVGVAIAPAAILVLSSSEDERSSRRSRSRKWLRPAGEAIVAIAATVSVVALTQKGAGDEPAAQLDFIAAASPLLLSLLGCVVALRLYPVFLKRAFGAARKSLGPSSLVGVGRAIRSSAGGFVPVVAVLIGVSVALFSAVLSSTLATGVAAAAEAGIGADLALDDVRLDADDVDRIRELDGVSVAAAVSTEVFHNLVPDGEKRIAVTAILIDSDDFANVQDGLAGSLQLPRAFSTGGSATTPIIASRAVATRLFGARNAQLDRNDVTFVGTAQDGAFFKTTPSWVLVDRANADAITFGEPDIANQVLIKLRPGASAAELEAEVLAIGGPGSSVHTPAEAAQRQEANPAVGGVRTAALIAIGGSALLSFGSLALTAVLDARERRRTYTLLSRLGFSRAQGRRSVFWELAPLSVVGLAIGILLGTVLSLVTISSTDLRPFTSGTAQVELRADVILTVSVVLGYAGLLAASALAAARHAVPRQGRERAGTGAES